MRAAVITRIQTRGMRLRYPERVIYPVAGFTKADVVRYYEAIAPAILPHLRNRPVTLKRYPSMAHEEHFYEKDAPAFTPKWVKTFAVWRRSGASQIHYIVINDKRTLLWAASVGTLEFHPFLARADDFDSPTQIVFDLDPGEGADILRCAAVAFRLRDLLAKLELRSFAKVSGSKGLQVYAPLNTPASYSATEPFARTVAEMLASEHPREIVAEMATEKRRNKVFIDWSQNADYKTTVAAYSLRAKRWHPYVSAPVTWDELESAVRDHDAKALDFRPEVAVERVRKLGDLFEEVETLKQHIPEAFVHRVARLKHAPRMLAPKSATARKRPRASEQGGRRRFWITKENGLRLTIEIHEQMLIFALERLPMRTGESQPAKPISNPPSQLAVWDKGTVELLEGIAKRGYLELYFDGAKLKGEYILRREGEWELIRPARDKDYAPDEFLHPRRAQTAARQRQWLKAS